MLVVTVGHNYPTSGSYFSNYIGIILSWTIITEQNETSRDVEKNVHKVQPLGV
jgi:hypothetical protein